MVAEDLPGATRALLSGDSEAVRVLVEREQVIDALYPEMEELVNRLILLQAPVASAGGQGCHSGSPSLLVTCRNHDSSEVWTGWRAVGGGNIDCKELVAGSILYLPVAVPGALISIGDGHAAQGDGEVAGTAIECGMTTELQLKRDRPCQAMAAAPLAGHRRHLLARERLRPQVAGFTFR